MNFWIYGYYQEKDQKDVLATSTMSKTKLFWYVPYDLNEMSHYFHYRQYTKDHESMQAQQLCTLLISSISFQSNIQKTNESFSSRYITLPILYCMPKLVLQVIKHDLYQHVICNNAIDRALICNNLIFTNLDTYVSRFMT